MESFVCGFGGRIISCFSARPRLTASQRRNEIVSTDRAAFPLCVYSEDTPALLDADNWPKNIVISDWHFNAKYRLQSVPTVAIYDVESYNRTSADKGTIAADHPAVVEYCDDGEPSAATSTGSAVTKVLGFLRSMETLSALT